MGRMFLIYLLLTIMTKYETVVSLVIVLYIFIHTFLFK